MLMRNVLFACSGLKIRLSCTDTRNSDRALRTGPMMFCAMGVGTMPCAVRTNSGSLKVSRSRARALETAGWVMPTICPARVRLASV
ncbi:hypothetical protein D3C81_1783630 [compost metagenome]